MQSQKNFILADIIYRYENCRNCKTCKEHKNPEIMSIREEVEQDIINKSVKVNINKSIAITTLPLVHDPVIKLALKKDKALRVYH